MDFVQALKRPYTCWREFLLFSLCYLIPIVNFFSFGYALRAAKTAMSGKPLEEWKDWGLYFRMGFFHAVISFVYMLPLLFLVVGGILGGVLLALTKGGVAVVLVILILLPIVLVVGVLSVFVRWAALMAYVETGMLGPAFDLRAVLKTAFTMAFFVGWLKQLLVAMIYGLLMMPFLLPFIILDMVFDSLGSGLVRVFVQILLTAAFSFPIMVSSMSVLGDAYKQARRFK